MLSNQTMITVTDHALEMMQEFLASENKEGYGLRILASGGGCAGYQYEMDVEEAPKPEDEVIDLSGVRIFVDAESSSRLKGAEIDFVEGLEGPGFSIQNPNAKSSCGCGTSF
jgi:iron-sulfur cluster assembly accessory protein